MADAPSTGGGSSWGPFEVILALVLAIGLLSNIGNKNTSIAPVATINPIKTTTPTYINTANTQCGLSVTSPFTLQKVGMNVRVAGAISGCDWNPNGATLLYAQVINPTGIPLSDFTPVSSSSQNIDMTFDAYIPLITNPGSGVGYVILVPASDTNNSVSARIPIELVRN